MVGTYLNFIESFGQIIYQRYDPPCHLSGILLQYSYQVAALGTQAAGLVLLSESDLVGADMQVAGNSLEIQVYGCRALAETATPGCCCRDCSSFL